VNDPDLSPFVAGAGVGVAVAVGVGEAPPDGGAPEGAAVGEGVIGRLVKKFGEQRLIFVSMIIFAAGLAGLPFVTHLPGILTVLALLAIGSGLNRPPVFGMISLNSPSNEQGANLGVAQSFGALARMISPVFASTLYFVKPSLPYLICGGIALLTGLFAWRFLCRNSTPAAAMKKPADEFSAQK
jgi:MFS family permease